MLSPWNKSHEKPRQYIKKQRHYFADKYLCNQSYGFSSSHAGMWELDHKEGWVPKNWCFWTMVRSRLLRVPWTAKKSNQSSLKEISPEYSSERLMLKLKLQSFGYLMWRVDSLEKTLMLGKIEAEGEGDDRGQDVWMASPNWWTWVSASSERWWRTGRPGMLQSSGSRSQTQLNDWTITTVC